MAHYCNICKGKFLLSIIVFLFNYFNCVNAESIEEILPARNLQDIKNPETHSPVFCGHWYEETNICDPDGTISRIQALIIHERIKEIYNETQNGSGFIISVILVGRFDLQNGKDPKAIAKDWAEDFQRKAWDSSVYNSTLVIVGSWVDKTIASSMGLAAQEGLITSKCLDDIEKISTALLQGGHLSDAVLYMIDQYGLVLTGKDCSFEMNMWLWIIVIFAVGTLTIVLIYGFYKLVLHRNKTIHYYT